LVAVFVLYDIDQVFLILYPDSFKVDIGVGSEGISYNLLERKLSPHYIDTFLTKHYAVVTEDAFVDQQNGQEYDGPIKLAVG
jgi:hypothetical protein